MDERKRVKEREVREKREGQTEHRQRQTGRQTDMRFMRRFGRIF